MSVKYSYDKANNVYYFRKNGKKIASATTEEALTEKLMQLGKESEIIPISTLTVRDAINSFLPYSQQTTSRTHIWVISISLNITSWVLKETKKVT